MNEVALLGWGLVDKETEYEKIKNKQNDHLLLNIANILNEFDIQRVEEDKAVFYYSRLYFLNNKSLIRKYIKSDEKYRPMFVNEFKTIFKRYFKGHEEEISRWNEDYWQKIIEIVIVSLIFILFSHILTHLMIYLQDTNSFSILQIIFLILRINKC